MFTLLCLFYLPGMVCSGPGYQVIIVAVARGQMAYVYGFGFDGDDDSHVCGGNRVISITLKPVFYEAEFPLQAEVGRGILDCELHVCGPSYGVVEYLGKVLESRVFVPSRVCYQTRGLYIEAAAFRWVQCVSYSHLYLSDGVECQVP